MPTLQDEEVNGSKDSVYEKVELNQQLVHIELLLQKSNQEITMLIQ